MNLLTPLFRSAFFRYGLPVWILAAGSPAWGTLYSDTVKADLPVFYWNFDEEDPTAFAEQQMPLPDPPPVNALLPVSGAGARFDHAAASSGLRLGRAAELNGGFFLNFGLQSPPEILSGAYAVEMWVQSLATNSATYLANFGPEGADNHPAVIYGFTGDHVEQFGNGRTGTGGPVVTDNAWHHLLMVNYGPGAGDGDADRVDFWLDGVHTPLAGAVARQLDLRGLVVGAALRNGANRFTGRIDELAVYDWSELPDAAAVTAKGQEVAFTHRAAALAAAGEAYSSTVLADSPVMYWSFDESEGIALQQVPMGVPVPEPYDNSLNSLMPSSGATRASHDFIASGLQLGNAAEFDGLSSFQLTGGLKTDRVAIEGPWAVEFWVQLTGPQQNRYLLNFGGGARNNPAVIYGYFGPRLEIFGGGGRSGDEGVPVDDQNWHHVMLVNYRAAEEGSTTNRVDVFLDGLQYPNVGNGSNPVMDFADWLIVGAAENSNTGGLLGRMDELAVYSFAGVGGTAEVETRARALVASHYAAAYETTPGGTVTITAQPEGIARALGQSASFAVTATSTGTASPLTYQWFKNDVAIEGATAATYTIPMLSLYDIGSHAYTVRVSAGGVFAVSAPAVLSVAEPAAAPATAYRTQIINDAPLLYYSFDEFTGPAMQLMPLAAQPVTVENDLIPSDGFGARISHQEQGTGLRLGQAADLSGGFFQNFSPLSGITQLTGAYAVEVWFRNAAENTAAYLMNFGPSGGDNSPAVIYNFSTAQIELYGGANGRTGAGGPLLTDPESWHHLMVVHYGSLPGAENRVDFWLDGVAAPAAGTVTGGLNLRGIIVGAALPNGANAFIGQLDEVAIYNLAELPDAAAVTVRAAGMVTARLDAARAAAGPAYSEVVLEDSPVFYYSFDEAEGNAEQQAPVVLPQPDPAATRLAPSSSAGRVQHGETGSGLLLGNAADLRGNAWFQSGPLNIGPALQPPWAVEFWLQVLGENNTDRFDWLLNFGTGSPAFIYDRSGDQLEMFSGESSSTFSGPVIADSNWHHVLWVFHGDGQSGVADKAELWLDGMPTDLERGDFSAPLDLMNALTAGARTPGYDAFTGRIDEIAIYQFAGLDNEAAVTARAEQLIQFHRSAAGAVQPPVEALPPLEISATGGNLTLSWTGAGAPPVLQTSPDLLTWTDVPGPFTSPLTLPAPAQGARVFYRLIRR